MKMTRLIWIGLGFSLCWSTAFAAADTPALRQWLSREIIRPELPMAEVQAFLEPRVPVMPELSSADDWTKTANDLRRQVLNRVVFRGQAARWRSADTRVKWLETIEGGPGYRIRKVRYEALPGLWIPALLYEPDRLSGKVPAVLNVNGHDGEGKAADYKQIRCINQAKRGMLALNVEWLGMGQLQGDGYQHYRMNQLDLCGTSGIAPYFLAMKRGLDLLLDHPHADPDRVAVAGLSGGGWQTIFISALDPRVTLANPVAGYSSYRTRIRHLEDLGDSEQTPSDLATVVDYTHLTAMRAPRPTLLTFNVQDNCCFASGHALPPLLNAAAPVFKLFSREDHLRAHINHEPGTHNFGRDNREAFYRFLGEFLQTNPPAFSWLEIPCENEVKSSDQLHVEVPPDNADFNSLALALGRDLPQPAPTDSDRFRRDQLRRLVRPINDEVTAEAIDSTQENGIHVTWWRCGLKPDWTVPMIELTPSNPSETVLMMADQGRTNLVEETQAFLAADRRVLMMDPFYLGESKIQRRDYLFALLVAAVGERPMGIQAGQIMALARWATEKYDTGAVSLFASGPRIGMSALVAAVLETDAVAGIEWEKPLGSLKELLEQNASVKEMPELFCFGLLEQFDVRHLAELLDNRPFVLRNPSRRAQTELEGVAQWQNGSIREPRNHKQ